jgi:cytochrome P450
MPFGRGPRVCLGLYLAEIEAKVILQIIIENYSVSLTEPEREIFMDGGFTLRPYLGLQLRVQRHSER